ncbi:hypothetical protein MHUMG1_05754 [Metarhizium humberi]|uniref:SCP domain-containing protein n=1 Tax=Metarhizium humberi TaxID=2596975 RepID=A0A9P8M8H0_9HYPO|nr:hypothetical protein MHUMG1_05754 [Metarhizium humberi]
MRLSSILPTLTATGMAMAAPTEKRQSGDFKSEMLAAHNFFRSQHGGSQQGVNDLTWDDKLANTAQPWSAKCVFEHNKSGYGENIAYHSAKNTAWGEFVNMWGEERKQYNFDQGGFSSGTGHFTQVVWKGTTTVGCGQTWCDGTTGNIKGLFVVCNYNPPGNYNNDYKNNVLKQTKGSPSDVYQAGKQPDKEPPKEPEQPPKEPEQPPKEPEQPPKEPEQPPKEPEQPPKEPEEPEDDCENEEGDPEWNQDGDQEGNQDGNQDGNQEGNQEWDWNHNDWQDQDWDHNDWNNNDWSHKDWSKYWNKE